MLTSKDTIILDSLFNPEAASDQNVAVDESLPVASSLLSSSKLKQIQEQELSAIRTLESHLSSHHFDISISVSSNDPTTDAAVQDTLDSATETLTSIIESHPDYASAYTNRAQCTAIRLTQSGKSAYEILGHDALMNDLETAIKLASPYGLGAKISKADARVLATAHTQRASLYLAASRYLANHRMLGGGPVLRNDFPGDLSKVVIGGDDTASVITLLEEQASREFFLGGRYGNKLAGAMVLRTNPYAKSCGNIVKEAMRSEFAGTS